MAKQDHEPDWGRPSQTPNLSTFGGGLQSEPDADIPAYEEGAREDDTAADHSGEANR